MLAFANLAFFSTLVTSLSLCIPVFAGSHEVAPHRRHPGVSRIERNSTLQKRDGLRFTFYKAGLGACGATNSDSDFIVALNSDQYGNGSNCFKMITITYNGKSTQAQITDECPGCPHGGLDLTPALFGFFASQDAGVIYGSWEFGGEAAAPAAETPKTKASPTPTPTPSPSPSPTPSPTPKPTPPPAKEVDSSKSSPTPSPTPSPSSTSSVSSFSSSSSSAPSSNTSATSASAHTTSSSATSMTPSASATVLGVLDQVNDAYAGLLGLLVAANQSH